MTGVVPVVPRFRFTNAATGLPYAFGKLTVYEAGTTTLANTYQDRALTSANTNPITLDANGECLFWVDSTSAYKILLQDAALATVPGYPVDNIPGAADVASAAAAVAEAAAPYLEGAQEAEANAEAARDNAILAAATVGVYPNAAASNVPRGLTQASVGAITAGSGGTNGTFALGWSGGNFSINPTGTFTVSGGALTAVTITGPGLYIGASPTVPTPSFSASAGLTGAAVVLTAQFLVTSGQGYWVQSSDNLFLNRYKNVSGVATAESGVVSLSTAFTLLDAPGYLLAFGDKATGKISLGLRRDGTWDMSTVNSPLKDHTERHGGRRFPSQMIHISDSGQSNGYGASGALTTTQEYDNLRFNQKETSPTVFRKAIRVDGEDPSMGTLSAIKQLLLEEDGLTFDMNDFVLVSTNNAVPANTIDQLSEGGSSGAYEAAMSQVTSGVSLAAGLGKTWSSGGQTWTQGEADAGMAEDTYKAKLTAYAENVNTDVKAITGQTWDVPLITWQVGSNVNKSVAVAQWKAAQEHPLVFCACPAYMFPYGDFQHVTNVGARWLGGYFGRAWKRIVIDRVGWEPLQPVSVQMVGNNLDVYFNKDGLTLDTTIVPAQTNSGFSVENASAVAQTINSVTVLPGNRVRIALAATPAAGWKVKYGHNTATGMSPYTGGAGNLRDTDLWVFKTKTMHNWCVIFDWTV